jgi:hypothetical protein
MASKVHTLKGWSFYQSNRGQWLLVRISDGFRSWHNSYDGCCRYIRKHGNAADPDASYEAAMA